jgi:hypothetical protein
VSALELAVLGARAEAYAAVPTLVFRLAVSEATGEPIHAIALRCQIQIEPRRRHYAPDEERRLLELFGEPRRWGDTLKTVLWTQLSLMVPGFRGGTEIDMPVPCTYDLEVAAAKYFAALDDGEVALRLLFSGTIFARGTTGFSVEPVSWNTEAAYRLPVSVWRELMDRYFPGSAWIRLRRESVDALHEFKARRALPTWDDAVAALLAGVEREGAAGAADAAAGSGAARGRA